MDRRIRVSLFVLVLAAFFLVSCASGASQPTAEPNTTAPAPTEGAAASGDQIVLTKDDSGKTVDMKVGQKLIVQLGSEADWKVDVTPTFILSPVDNATLNPGEQGVFEAKMNGQATVQATGSSGQFTVKVIISQ